MIILYFIKPSASGFLTWLNRIKFFILFSRNVLELSWPTVTCNVTSRRFIAARRGSVVGRVRDRSSTAETSTDTSTRSTSASDNSSATSARRRFRRVRTWQLTSRQFTRSWRSLCATFAKWNLRRKDISWSTLAQIIQMKIRKKFLKNYLLENTRKTNFDFSVLIRNLKNGNKTNFKIIFVFNWNS